jgi:diadenosine tetraphosphate (Ap4A) HIT family hydrolase
MKEYIIYETKYWKVFLNQSDQYCLGRSVVLLKRSCKLLSGITKEEIINLLEIIKKLENALTKSFGATMFNWTCLMNDSYKRIKYREKKDDPQVHLHFRPRYKNKIKFAGEVFIDEEFARHYKRKSDKQVSDKVLKKIVEKIKGELK